MACESQRESIENFYEWMSMPKYTSLWTERLRIHEYSPMLLRLGLFKRGFLRIDDPNLKMKAVGLANLKLPQTLPYSIQVDRQWSRS